MTNHTNLADEDRVYHWLEEYTDPEVIEREIEDIGEGRDGMTLILNEELDPETFESAINESSAEEVPLREEEEKLNYEAELVIQADEPKVNVFLLEEVSKGVILRQKVGVTYRQEKEIPLGGVFTPLWKNMEPAGETAQHTLNHIVLYLNRLI